MFFSLLAIIGILSLTCKPEPSESKSVTSVTVTPATVEVEKGKTQQFDVVVAVKGGAANTVTWTVTGGITGTSISNTGLLTIAAGETASSLKVRATSTVDTAKYSEATVTVKSTVTPAVTSVTVTPAAVDVEKGATQQFNATVVVTGGAAQSVTWTLTSDGITGTSLSNTGLLTIAEGETAATLTVRATSTVDSTKFGEATVTVREPGSVQPSVTSVTVSPAAVEVEKGKTQLFTVVVDVEGGAAETVTWSVTSETTGTTITDGLLTVAADEAAASLTVKATSTADTTKFGEATVTVKTPGSVTPTVTSVAVSPSTADVDKGKTQQFSATVTVTGGAEQTVTWSVTGGITGTSVTDGLLTVALAETATTLKVRATSTADTTKFGEATVTVKDPPVPVTELAITGVTAPVTAAEPVAAVTNTTQYTGTVSWSPAVTTEFLVNQVYTATITLTARAGFTFTGVAANSFTVTGGTATNPANSGIVTVVFPATVPITPIVADFIVHTDELTQTAGSVQAVNVTAETGKTIGNITVLYSGSATVPQTAGTYPITINVAAAGNYAAVNGLAVGTLTVHLRHIAILDFDVVGLRYPALDESETAEHEVTWAHSGVWNTGAAITVSYKGINITDYAKSTDVPTEIGDYEVIIDVAENEGYFNAVSDLFVAYTSISQAKVVVGGVALTITEIEQFTDKAKDLFTTVPTFSLIGDLASERKITLVTDLDDNQVRWRVGSGDFELDVISIPGKTLDVSELYRIGLYAVTVEIKVDGIWYNQTFSIRITL